MHCSSQRFSAHRCSCSNAESTVPLSDLGRQAEGCVRTGASIRGKIFPSLSCGISVVWSLITGEEFHVGEVRGKARTAGESGNAAEVFAADAGVGVGVSAGPAMRLDN